MHTKLKEDFVRQFFLKSAQARPLELLAVQSSHAVEAFMRWLDLHIDRQLNRALFVERIPARSATISDLYEKLRDYNVEEECYLISSHPDIDDQVLPIREALAIACPSGLVNVLYFHGRQLAFITYERGGFDIYDAQRKKTK